MTRPSILRVLSFIIAAAGLGADASAQPSDRATPALEAPLVAWRAPALQVAGAEQPVRLQSLKLDVEVSGGVAQTRVELVFFNPNARTLEGKLQFPLGPGQVVSGFALDVDGRLRDAVPVQKAQAQQIFEDITRRRVDPGLLQTTLGNNYELRVYPLLAGKTRTVALTIVESATGRLQLPLAYAERVTQFELALRYPAAVEAPALLGLHPPGLRFEPDRAGGYTARWSARDAVLPREPLRLSSPGAAGEVAVATQARDGQTYFTVELPVATRREPRRLPRRVQLVWDASGSGSERRIDRELALLDAYFSRAGNVSVNLVRVADAVGPSARFEVRGGDWSALRRALESTSYDGASHLGAVRHDGWSEEALWFTDGVATYGAPWRLAFPVPVFTINSAASSDPAALQALADATGGRSIDLGSMSREAAVSALLTRGSELDGHAAIDSVGAVDIVVQSQSVASGRLVLAGRLAGRTAAVTVRLRDSAGQASRRTVRVEAGRNPSQLAALQWARLTLASLEGEARSNRARIRDIGQRFGLATRETSLLVLELVEDYVAHGIEPPTELRAAYDALAASRVQRKTESDAARLARVVRRFEARVAWWHRDFPKDEPPAPLKIAMGSVAALGDTARPSESRRGIDGGGRQNRLAAETALSADRGAPAAAASPTAPSPVAPATLAGRRDAGSMELAKSSAPTDGRAAPSIGIALTPAANASETLQRLRAAPPQQWQRIYLDERRAAGANVGFFLEAAEFFLAKGLRAEGLQALSNLAELDLQNRQILRLLAYRLQQAGELGLALPIFERVLELAPDEPQSHRDLGLAWAQAGEHQRAVDRLHQVATGAWSSRFADIELIALHEMNAVIERSGREGRRVDVSAIDPRLVRNLPVDVRVVLAWDADNTDVDLHVVDPNGEEVYYGRSLSYQGGAITRDATGGYGPEEFVLKEAKPGKYRVEAQFFGHRQQVLTTRTGLMLWLSSRFGSAGQKDERTTIRVRSEGGQRVVVGEFEVKP
ncbi:MAG TPA: VIT domain-containing protein [Caldimonas sp.]|jgi:hypothetical protein|nr:VIT domain-containing protein [Caldimonas sp.]HEX2542184.1 VIT domain-containing protein [Caldimonas sp.]